MPRYTTDLKLISKEDQLSLGQIFSRYELLNRTGLPTPEGFVIGFENFDKAVVEFKPQLKNLILGPKTTSEKVKAIQKLLLPNLELDPILKTEIQKKLSQLELPYLIRAAVLNNKNHETITFETVTRNISDTYEAVLRAWTSYIDNTENLDASLENSRVSVCISQKSQPDISGRALILGGESGLIELQAQWGEFRPTEKSDRVQLNYKTLTEESYLISPQRYQLIYKSGKFESLKVSEKFQNSRKIQKEHIDKIAKGLKKLHSILATSLEFSFEITDNKIILDELNLNIEKGGKTDISATVINLPVLKNLKPLIPGMVSGFGKLIETQNDLNKLQTGDIAILTTLKKEYLPHLKKASGIVVQNSQSLSKQLLPKLQSLGITAAIGSIGNLPKQVLTLNGKTGKVYLGAFSPVSASKTAIVATETKITEVKTATKLFITLNSNSVVNLKNPNIDGIGPVRPELFFTRIGIHPKELVNKKQFNQVASDISNHLTLLCNSMVEKPVIYQVSDFKSNELIHLEQGLHHETPETNPFLGKRGIERHLRNSEIIKAELNLIKNLRNKDNLKNLWVSLPFIRTKAELAEIKKIVSQTGLNRSPSFKLLVTISTPANIYEIEELIAEGIDGCLVDYFDLANLLYGKDFSYLELANLKDEAIVKALKSVLKPITKAKLFSGIFNVPPEANSTLLKELVTLGIKSVSVSEINLEQTKIELAKAEKQLVAKTNN